MKSVVFFIFLFVATSLVAQEKNEYCILRVTYSVKPNNLDSKLSIDLGTNSNHSLKGIFENTKGGTISVNNADGTVTVIKDEVDFLTIISKYGFKLINSYTMTLLEKSYANFIFEKKENR
ncbi:MAG TPA: hypothetical protein PLP65_04095 [Bacteroidales bacterium]|jgi:hypothetical protein|nr:hypothetical protein [Bacteroidales bacterium]